MDATIHVQIHHPHGRIEYRTLTRGTIHDELARRGMWASVLSADGKTFTRVP